MGLILSKTISYYGFNAVRLDENGVLVGFVKRSGETIYYDGITEQINMNTVTTQSVTADSFITGLTLTGPVNELSHGTLMITDSSGATFQVLADVRVPED